MKKIAKSIRLKYTKPGDEAPSLTPFEKWYLGNAAGENVKITDVVRTQWKKWEFALNADGTYEQIEVQKAYKAWNAGMNFQLDNMKDRHDD